MCHITSRVALSPMSSVAQDQGYLGTHRTLEIMSPHALIHKTDPGREHWALDLSPKYRKIFTIFREDTFINGPLQTESQTEIGTLVCNSNHRLVVLLAKSLKLASIVNFADKPLSQHYENFRKISLTALLSTAIHQPPGSRIYKLYLMQIKGLIVVHLCSLGWALGGGGGALGGNIALAATMANQAAGSRRPDQHSELWWCSHTPYNIIINPRVTPRILAGLIYANATKQLFWVWWLYLHLVGVRIPRNRSPQCPEPEQDTGSCLLVLGREYCFVEWWKWV